MWILSRTAGMSVWTSSVVIAESVDTAFLGGQWWDSAAAGLTPWLKMQQGLLWTQWEASLPVQETWVWPLIWVDPTCCKAAKPLNHNYRACAVDPGNCSCGSLCARELCSATGEATLQEKPTEDRTLPLESRPCLPHEREARVAVRTQHSQK